MKTINEIGIDYLCGRYDWREMIEELEKLYDEAKAVSDDIRRSGAFESTAADTLTKKEVIK